MLKKSKIFLILAAATLLFYLPIIIKPSLFLDRRNDMNEFFLPILYFVKNQILINKSLPFWLPNILSGTPLLPDPQSQIFYLPNLLLVFLPLKFAVLTELIFHTFLGSIAMYLLARQLKFGSKTSMIAAIFYTYSPKLAAYIEAGHYGLINANTWIPFVALFTIRLAQKPKAPTAIFLALSLSAIYFTHAVTFIIVSFASAFLFLATSKPIKHYKKFIRKASSYLLATIVTFGLLAFSFLPQIEWVPSTTRQLLLASREIYPIWNSKLEFLKIIFVPWLSTLKDLNTEKALTIGISLSFLSAIGLLRLRQQTKIVLLAVLVLVFLVSLNNASPLFTLTSKVDFFILMRVSTRAWFIVTISVSVLATQGIDVVSRKNPSLGKIIYGIAITEVLAISWLIITKPITSEKRLATKNVLEYVSKNAAENSRVFCLTRCFSQSDVIFYDLQTIEGYSTLIQLNYFQHAWQLTGAHWDYYSLSVPPIGSYKYETLNPNFESLGEYSVYYVVSPYQLENEDLSLDTQLEDFYIYRNKKYLSKARFLDNTPTEITVNKPNFVRVNTKNKTTKQLVLAEVYSPGWKAYLNGQTEVPVQETPNRLRLVDTTPETAFVDFRYRPSSFSLGTQVTAATLVATSLYFFLTRRSNHHKRSGATKK